jgi:hypothetical protein
MGQVAGPDLDLVHYMGCCNSPMDKDRKRVIGADWVRLNHELTDLDLPHNRVVFKQA